MNNVTILRCTAYNEYRVPSTKGTKHEASAYYTDDREDALATAIAMHGENVEVKFRSVSEWPDFGYALPKKFAR